MNDNGLKIRVSLVRFLVPAPHRIQWVKSLSWLNPFFVLAPFCHNLTSSWLIMVTYHAGIESI